MELEVEEEEAEETGPHLGHDDGFAGSVFDSEYDAGAIAAAAAEEAAEWEPSETVKLGRVVGTWPRTSACCMLPLPWASTCAVLPLRLHL